MAQITFNTTDTLPQARTTLNANITDLAVQLATKLTAASVIAPFIDSTAIVKGSVDATKLLRFEVDGFTTVTTRVLTAPNFDGTIATLAGTETLSNKAIENSEIGGISPTVGTFTELNADTVTMDELYAVDTKVVGAQGAAVANATDAATAITQLNTLLARLRAHGLIAT